MYFNNSLTNMVSQLPNFNNSLTNRLSQLPNELKECILEKIAVYKIRVAFAKALLRYIIRRRFYRCEECNSYTRETYVEDACAESVLGPLPCCIIYLCKKCKDTLPLECGHKILKEDYYPKDSDYYYGYYCHEQFCSQCNKEVNVSRQWDGMCPQEWLYRYN